MFFQSLMMAGICRSLDSSAITCRQLYRSRLFKTLRPPIRNDNVLYHS